MSAKKITYIILFLAVAIIGWTYMNAINGNGTMAKNMNIVIDASDVEMVSMGENVYAANCAQCHGQNLEGQPDWKKKNADNTLPAPPHDASGHTWHHPDMMNFNYTKFGGKDNDQAKFKTAMPAFGEVLKDKEIVAVLAFIKSKWPDNIQTKHDRMSKRMMQGMKK